MRTSAFRTFVRYALGYHNLAALVTVIRRDPMPPPDLPGDTPVADILKPVQIDLVESLRHKP